MPVTIRDVARKLKLSITTVSRALDGYSDVAASTRERVVLAARTMGYEPSRAARQLRRRRTDIIGTVLPTDEGHFADAYFSSFLAGLGDGATSLGFDLLVSTARPDSEAERQLYARWAHGRIVDGIVLNRMRLRDRRVQFLAREGIPFVAHGRTRLDIDFPYVDMDSRAAFCRLVIHLTERGHRRIGYIGAPMGTTLQADRQAGCRDGLRAAGLASDDLLVVRGDLTRQGGYLGAKRLLTLKKPPTAIIGANDLTAIGAMRAVHEAGLEVGRDVAVAGYDGTEDAAHAQPPLTTLTQPIYEIAHQLAEMLIGRIAGTETGIRHVILKPELVVRGSTQYERRRPRGKEVRTGRRLFP